MEIVYRRSILFRGEITRHDVTLGCRTIFDEPIPLLPINRENLLIIGRIFIPFARIRPTNP